MQDDIKLYGEITGYLYSEEWVKENGVFTEEGVLINTDEEHKVMDVHNAIGTPLKTRLRDSLISDTGSTIQYMGENGYFTTNTSGASENGNDGMVLYDSVEQVYYTLITVAHPTDPSGSYYKKFRGQITFVNTNTYSTTRLGLTWTSGSPGAFANDFATGTAGTLTPAAGAVYVLDWKIAVA